MVRSKMRAVLLLAFLAFLSGLSSCARILAILPFPSKSHSILQFSIFRLLAARGHEVVVYSGCPPPSPTPNVTHYPLKNSVVNMANDWTFDEFKEICNMFFFFGFGVKGIWEIAMEPNEAIFKDENVKKLLQSKEEFDLVFVEATFGQESMLVFGHRFKAPVVNFQGFGTWSLIDWVSGNSLSISHVPEVTSFPFNNQMSFKERFQNVLSTIMTLLFYHYDHLPRHQKIVDKHFPEPSVPPVIDMLRDISIHLVNARPTMEYAKPYSPNIIPVAGAHMSSHKTPLPQDIKKFMDDSKEGVIFFSLGTVVPAHSLPIEYLQAFANTFKKLRQKVLWKISLESIPGLPKNVKLTKWVPQPTVLAHPNCVLFMTHGGLFSQHEALFAGVPVVGIPFFGDQRFNVRFYEHLGVGVKLEFLTVTEESVYEAVTTVLNDKKYKKNAEKVSKIVRDEMISGADSAVFWVEYVLRHGGAPHLRPASAQLRWYQLLLLDVVTAVLVPVMAALFVFYKMIKILFKYFFGRWSRNVTRSKKKN